MTMTRKFFLVRLAGGTGMLVLGGCGGGGSNYGAAPPPPAAGTCSATISLNHGHELTVPAAALSSTVAITYDIEGSAGHSHLVTFSPANLADLKAGRPVSVVSTMTSGHDHNVTELCT